MNRSVRSLAKPLPNGGNIRPAARSMSIGARPAAHQKSAWCSTPHSRPPRRPAARALASMCFLAAENLILRVRPKKADSSHCVFSVQIPSFLPKAAPSPKLSLAKGITRQTAHGLAPACRNSASVTIRSTSIGSTSPRPNHGASWDIRAMPAHLRWRTPPRADPSRGLSSCSCRERCSRRLSPIRKTAMPRSRLDGRGACN